MSSPRDRADRRFRDFCSTGDPEALAEVFDATAGPLSRVALWLAGNRTDAEDLLQGTFVKAIEARHDHQADLPVLPWLMGILGNEGRRLRRRRERSAVAVGLPEPVQDPRDVAAVHELQGIVREIGEQLGKPYCEVLELHLERGLNCNEIAERLGRPAGTVRTQLVRALEGLRRRLPEGIVGATAVVALAPECLAGVRRSVLARAGELVPAGATAAPALAAAGVPAFAPIAVVAMMALLVGVGIVGGWYRTEPAPSHAMQVASFVPEVVQPVAASTSQQSIVRRIAVPQDPVAELPRLERLGRTVGEPGIVLDAAGQRSGANLGGEDVLLRIDRAAPWQAVTGLLDELQRNGTRRVRFLAQTASGEVGEFVVALPKGAEGGNAVELRLHRERPGVEPSSIVPVLSRMVAGRTEGFAKDKEPRHKDLVKHVPGPFTVAIVAPSDAAFGQVLATVAAVSRSGVPSVRLRSVATDVDPTMAFRPLAIDLGPAPMVAVQARRVPDDAAGLGDEPVGCLMSPTSDVAEPFGGAAGGRYGGRGGTARVAAGQELDWSPPASIAAGLAWLATMQTAEGGIRGVGGRPEVEATALTALALLGHGTTMTHGDGHEVLSRCAGWLLAQQADDGCLAPKGAEQLRCHALATYALAEAYGLGVTLNVRGGLQAALAWLGAQRRPDGGFGDALGTAAAAVAMVSAQFFKVGPPCEPKSVVAWFDTRPVQDDQTALAAELLARAFVGQSIKDLQVRTAATRLLSATGAGGDPWFEFWASHLAFQFGGEDWRGWMVRLREIAQLQEKSESASNGSWPAVGGRSQSVTTALRVLSLEAMARYTRMVR